MRRVSVSTKRTRSPLPAKSFVSLIAAIVATAVITILGFLSLNDRAEANEAVTRTTTTRNLVNKVMVGLEQAQGSQRGYLLVHDPTMLRWYELTEGALPGHLLVLSQLLAGQSEQLERLRVIESLARKRLDIIERSVELERAGNHEAAVAIVRDGRGRAAMEEIRVTAAKMLETIEADLRVDDEAYRRSSVLHSYVTFGGAGVLFAMLALVGMLASRDFRKVQGEAWVRQLHNDLGTRMQGDFRLESLGQKILDVLVGAFDAQVGAVYIHEGAALRRIAGHALPPDAPAHVKRGDGLLGEMANQKRLVHVADVPPAYLTVKSASGSSKPREVIVAPAIDESEVQAVIELGFLRRLDALDLEALDRLSQGIGAAVRTARDRSRLEELLEETQRQAEELQAQQEELRVTNEELEQQSKALQLSQTQLENQQSELEQINSQLEEQTMSLERQRDDLAKTGTELQRANAYKSQFLANMSHELRTPLNSSLILAKLLADNREGNLTTEQVQFANTIYSAGNDLLVLINDILDLSKIEAGMLDIRNEPVALKRVIEDLQATFAPVAEQKKLALELQMLDGLPEIIDTDYTRFQQILRNLVSNAIKFTEHGGVTLEMSARGEDVAISVRDTGIGIPPEQHDSIFEAFRQADGATNRKFGGTGLGLTISRDLARLLGGDLVVDSSPGRGSTFTLVLPRRAPARAVATPLPPPAPIRRPTTAPAAPAAARASVHVTHGIRPGPFEDDRAKVTAQSRSILVVEDDVAFARVLYDLGHELDFQVVVTTSGEDGIVLARQLAPNAIVLDISLPDRSGLAVLDALKRDASTRHIPVHVVSGHDYTRTALEMGAAGYALKPVERDRLVEAFKRLEERMTSKLRRVLVVEDDPVLRDSTARLLTAEDVEIVQAGSTAEALEQVRSTTFDCMVLDLTLPDRSGVELLEEMSRGEQYSFPPVIVYTGRPLTPDQVHQLERFSQTIIIKGAKSPERLLDEVTLFLHQVEAELPPERQRMLKSARDREAAFEGKRVLVVEDDVRNVFALTAVLEPKGATVAIARNGREALDYLRNHLDIDLVLMDIMMPEMDGLEAMRELRKEHRFARLPIIALTAKAMADDRDKCLDAGANDYIAKPLDVDKLLSLARVWIRK